MGWIMRKCQMYLLYITGCVLLFQINLLFGAPCHTVPISLSDLNLCKDGHCYFTQRAVVSLPIGIRETTCLEFISPDPTISPVTLNISTLGGYHHWTTDSIYYTDDPAVESKGWCGCPGGHPGVCPSCSAVVRFTDTVLCTHGLHKDHSCPLMIFGKTGDWCLKTGMQGYDRFKILRFKKNPTFEIDIVAQTANSSWAFEYIGETIQAEKGDTQFNFTIISDTSKISYIPDFAVFDKHDTRDFYLLPSTDVNSIDQYDSRKFGWYKSNLAQKVAPSLGNDIAATMTSCQHHGFSVTYPWLNVKTFLKERSTLLSSRIAPHALLEDPDYEDRDMGKDDPDHEVMPYRYMKEGAIIKGYQGALLFVGRDHNGNLLPDDTPNGLTFAANMTHVLCNFVGVEGIYNVSIDAFHFKGKYAYELPNTLAVTGTFAIVKVRSDKLNGGAGNLGGAILWAYCGTDGNVITQCTSFEITAVRWPDNQLIKIVLHYDGFHTAMLNTTTVTHSSLLKTPILSGNLEIAVDFHGLAIKFDSTTIKPKIVDAVVQDDNIILSAMSTTVGGQCYVHTEPVGVILTQPVNLGMVVSKTDLYVNYPQYKGNLILLLTCAENSDKKMIYYDNNKYIQPSNFTQKNSTWNDATDADNWNDIGKDVLNTFGFNFSTKFNWDWKHKLVYALVVVAIVVVIIVSIILLIKFRKSLYNKLPFGKGKKKYIKLL